MQKPPHKEEESSKPSSQTLGASSPQIPDSTSSSKTSCKSKHSPTAKEWSDKHDPKKCSPPAKEQKDKHDHKDCNTSTKPREWAQERDNKQGSDKNSGRSISQGSHKHGPSPCPSSLESRLEAHINSSAHSTSGSSHSRCWAQPLLHSLQAGCPDMLPFWLHGQPTLVDAHGLYPINSFHYNRPIGFSQDGVTPVGSMLGLHQVSSSMLQPGALFTPAMLPALCSLTPEQSAEIFHLGAKCQAMGTQLAKQFQMLSGLKAMHRAMAQATAHKTINQGWVERSAAYNILLSANASDKKCKRTLQKLHKEADQAWKH